MSVYCTDCHKPDPSMITAAGVGPVLWSHKRHAEYEPWACDECHHTDVPGEPQTACYRCHGMDYFADLPGLEESMHKSCLICHDERLVPHTDWKSFQSSTEELTHFRIDGEEGSFWWDHRFHAVGLSISCRDCHHNTIQKDGVFVTARRAGISWPEEAGYIQPCKDCHGPQGPAKGSPAAGTAAPHLEAAYERICIECHVRFEAGPMEWVDFFD
jgi:hypothetical protein